jgi:hypothetical protein
MAVTGNAVTGTQCSYRGDEMGKVDRDLIIKILVGHPRYLGEPYKSFFFFFKETS